MCVCVYIGIYIYIYIYIYITPLYKPDVTQSQFFCSFMGLNFEFSFSKTGCHTKVKEPSLLNYLPITRRRIVGVIPFSVLALLEIQTASSSIWTQVAMSISYDGNLYTITNSCIYIYIYIMLRIFSFFHLNIIFPMRHNITLHCSEEG